MVSRYYATKELLKKNITTLPITVEQIEKIITSYGFIIITYDTNCKPHIEVLEELGVLSLAKRTKAFTYISKSEKLVFIECGISTNDRRLLLAHELGHIVLGHMSNNCIVGYKPGGLIDEGQEDEANAFALEFLAPVCILDRKHITNVNSISSITLLDDKRSRLVADEIKNHKKFTDYELELCDQFETARQHKKIILPKLIVGLSICFIIFASGFALYMVPNIDQNTHSIQPAESINNDIKNDTVVVTKSGEKYHRPDCKHVIGKDNLIHMTIEDAQTAGYEPCADCKPDK